MMVIKNFKTEELTQHCRDVVSHDVLCDPTLPFIYLDGRVSEVFFFPSGMRPKRDGTRLHYCLLQVLSHSFSVNPFKAIGGHFDPTIMWIKPIK